MKGSLYKNLEEADYHHHSHIPFVWCCPNDFTLNPNPIPPPPLHTKKKKRKETVGYADSLTSDFSSRIINIIITIAFFHVFMDRFRSSALPIDQI